MVRDLFTRDYSRPHPQWTENRYMGGGTVNAGGPPDAHMDTGRYAETPMTIGDALRERCRIPAQIYFVAAILDDGKSVFYGGPDEWHKKELHTFFDTRAFEQSARRNFSLGPPTEDNEYNLTEYGRHSAGGLSSSSDYQSGPRRGYPRRAGHVFDPFEEEGSYKARKRPRAFRRDGGDGAGGGGDADVAAPIRMAHREIRVDDHKQIWDFCDTRFKNLQQTACKLVAKAWVKLVEPKKQSTHPYTGSDEKAPDWWPKPWGPTRDEKVRHKEPDHLYKKERVYLLNHILRMIVEPNSNQHADIQKLRLNVSKLEEATFEALSTFFLDKDNAGNAKKKPYLKEIFKVAKAQEKYKNGEVDGDFKVYVMADDKFPDDWQSGDEAPGNPKQEDEQSAGPRHSDRASASSHAASPQKTGSAHGGMLPTPASEQSPTGPVHGGGGGQQHFISDIPVRGQALPGGQVMGSELAPPDLHPYVDTSPIHPPSITSLQDLFGGQQAGAPGGLIRRPTAPPQAPPSHFSSPTDYGPGPTSAGSVGGPAMYPPPWQHGPPAPSTAPSSAPMYSFTPPPPPLLHPQPHSHQHGHQQQQQQQPPPPQQQQQGQVQGQPLQAPYAAQGNMQMAPHPQYMGGVADGLPAGSPVSVAGMFRTVNLPPSSVGQQGGYPTYDGRGMSHGGGPR